jgi:alkanesulfonate monooxygenase SsuD/methylene tetrahydromethanopterin reductase-like flavin-dependent oxidoreductase (luciferase family)
MLVLVLPTRHSLPFTKKSRALHAWSHGRLILSAGVGWPEVEFNTLGPPSGDRRQRMTEGIAALRAVRGDDSVSCSDKIIAEN